MQKYDPAKHHRRSIRLPGHDYSAAGAYFVTICVNYRHRLLGEVRQGIMVPSAAGEMVQRVWQELPLHYAGVGIDAFVVMPDHIHGVIVLQRCGGLALGDVMHRFKSFTTAKYRHGVRAENWQEFEQRLWLRNYYEHLIRDERALKNIRRYIFNNPIAWRKGWLPETQISLLSPHYHSLIEFRAVGKHITLVGETVWLACTMTQTQI